MIELPEAVTLARQLTQAVRGKRVADAVAGSSPHKFAWFHGDPADYGDLLSGKAVGAATSHGGFVEVELNGARLLFAEGVSLRLHEPSAARPEKHQLRLEFDDGSSLTASVQMYGGVWAFEAGTFSNPYYERARAAPSPLSEGFDREHFASLVAPPEVQKLSLKGALATAQRIPGLGNGVLQDILFAARLHPRRKLSTLAADEHETLFRALTTTLHAMTRAGGRDTERDLYGREGGYVTVLSRRTVGRPCPRCGTVIAKEQFLGGAIYVCPGCQAP